jgi:hypothetical protein
MSATIGPAIDHQPDTDRNSLPYLADDAPIWKDTRWESFEYLLEQTWFTRGWAIQEAALAKDGQMIWGEYQLDWTDLPLTVTWLQYRAFKLTAAIWTMILHAFLYWHYHQHTTRVFTDTDFDLNFLGIIDSARSLQFSDPRDMIFAFGKIVQDFDRRGTIHPDYNAPVSQIYQQFVMDHISHNRNNIILDYVSHTEESLQETAPSWFPRWNVLLTSAASRRSASGSPLRSRSLSILEPVAMDE